jgi:hypothetical protein
MEEGLPYVIAALFCERVIEGKDGVLSVIRITDKATIEFGTTDEAALKILLEAQEAKKIAPALQITGLIGIKSGPLSGKFTLHVEGVKPSGKRARITSMPVELHGGDSGQNIILNLVIAVDEEGVYWFDILWEDRLLTKIPLTIERGHKEGVMTGAGGSN